MILSSTSSETFISDKSPLKIIVSPLAFIMYLIMFYRRFSPSPITAMSTAVASSKWKVISLLPVCSL